MEARLGIYIESLYSQGSCIRRDVHDLLLNGKKVIAVLVITSFFWTKLWGENVTDF